VRPDKLEARPTNAELEGSGSVEDDFVEIAPVIGSASVMYCSI